METKDLFDLGLQADLAMVRQTPMTRRRVLKLGLLGVSAFLASCVAPSATSTSTSSGAVGASDSCVSAIPTETAGPYPADGSNASNQDLNALTLSGIVRNDMRTSLGTGNVAEGLLFNLEMKLVNINAGCAPLAGYAVYAWHCNRDGDYSMYSTAVVDEDYLRAVQAADSEGVVKFTSIFPGCYSGRWPHIHFEVYPSLETANTARNAVLTSQIALTQEACQAAYATAGYEASLRNLSQISLSTDNIFRDGADLQLATMTGDSAGGYTAKITVGIAA